MADSKLEKYSEDDLASINSRDQMLLALKKLECNFWPHMTFFRIY